MATISWSDRLYAALSLAHGEALRDALDHLEQAEKTPLPGWSEEKHRDYHKQAELAATQAARWLYIRLMQLDPN